MKKLSMALVLFTATAYAQNCPGYARQYDITLQAGSITGALANYTLLISGTYPYLAVGSAGGVTSALGYDVTFVQGATPLKWSMPIYASGTGQIKANVLVPSAAVGTVISMCTGKASVKSFQGGLDPYDAATQTALEFPAANLATDSSGVNTWLNHGVTRTTTGPTYLVDAASFDGASWLDTAAGTLPYGPASRTVTFWINPTVVGANGVFVSWGTLATNQMFCLYNSPSNKLLVYSGGADYPVNSATSLVVGSWHRLDVIYDKENTQYLSYYLDGVLDATGLLTQDKMQTALANTGIGRIAGISSNYYTGQMAGIRIANSARPDRWIAAEYKNQTSPGTFYSIVSVGAAAIPVISAATIVANSPISVKATWTTDIASNSQVSCGTVSGGPYTYASNIVNPNVNGWNVTAHSMASNPMPNGTVYCIVTSVSTAGGVGTSVEFGPILLPAMPVSLPIAMVTPVVKLMSKLGDRFNGTNGAPMTKAWSILDNGYFCWAEDNNEYMTSLAGWGNPDGSVPRWMGSSVGDQSGFVRFTDAAHTTGNLVSAGWQNGIMNVVFSNFWHPYGQGSCISVLGNIYNAASGNDYTSAPLVKSADHFISTINPLHNVGPDTTYITNMTCTGSGVVTATSKLNITDELPTILAPGHMAMYVAGATGTSVNGIFGDTVTGTATTISWINPGATCVGWSWSPTGGTGSGGGTISVHGWDVITSTVWGPALAAWIQNDGPGYENGTPWAGMDGFVYWFAPTLGIGLARMRVEDFALQNISKAQWYVGNQLGDDGIYDSNWSTFGNIAPTLMNPVQFHLRLLGKGANQPQMQYLTALHRYVVAFEISGLTDSTSGGTAIYDAGIYPWSPLTMIGSAQRNVDVYYHTGSGPEFPQFVAKSQTSANGVTSINLEHNGGNFGVDHGNPSANEYDMYMNAGLQFVVKPQSNVAPPALASGEVSAGMDVAYNFDVHPGSLSMPNAAPSDAQQKWAWKAVDVDNPMWTDQYGSILHSLPSLSSANGWFPSGNIHNIALPTPYAQPLPGALTLMNCFGHYPTTLLSLPQAGAIALKKGTDLSITWAGAKAGTITFSGTTITGIPLATGGSGYTTPPLITIKGDFRTTTAATATAHLTGGVLTSITIDNGGAGYYSDGTSVAIAEPTNNWAVSFLGTAVGNVPIPDNSIGCVVVRRDSSNRVSLYTSAGIGKSLPLAPAITATVAGPWTTSPLVIGDGGPSWGWTGAYIAPYGNSFWGVESLLRVWSRDLADDELIAEMAAIRGVLWARGKGSAIP